MKYCHYILIFFYILININYGSKFTPLNCKCLVGTSYFYITKNYNEYNRKFYFDKVQKITDQENFYLSNSVMTGLLIFGSSILYLDRKLLNMIKYINYIFYETPVISEKI